MKPPFKRLLIANRGEIALRILRTCRELGIEVVAVYSDADEDSRPVREADLAIRLGPAPASQSYLLPEAIVEAALRSGADAIHPGYGFLAESAQFARAVVAAGIVFVGPPPEVIDSLGNKLSARRLAASAGVPVVPGTVDPAPVARPDEVDRIVAEALRVGFPLLVKAAAGGGGRGMRRVATPDELPAALTSGSHEAAASFGDGSVYLEREIRPARHIEVQLVGDHTGEVVALGERDCSTQRRHQKLIEEAPAPGLSKEERATLHEMAVRLGRAAGLANAATAEFLRDEDGGFWFLEVNTRLQVEHGVTELVFGLDLVAEQLRLAARGHLSKACREAAVQAAAPAAHAIEVRLSAEDPARAFTPAPGRIEWWRMPGGPGIRVDSAIEAGDRIAPDYDPLIAKIMAVGETRDAALARLRRALEETEVAGLQTTLPFHRFALRHAGFVSATVSTEWADEQWDGHADRAQALEVAVLGAALGEWSSAGRADPFAASPAAPGTAGGRDGLTWQSYANSSRWRRVGRSEVVDRWPR